MSNPAVLLKIGQRIKETRIRERITQEELATASGVSPLTVANIEKGKSVSLLLFIFGESGTTGTGNPDQPDRTQKTARKETLSCTPFKNRSMNDLIVDVKLWRRKRRFSLLGKGKQCRLVRL